MVTVVRSWGGETFHSCAEALFYFPRTKSKPSLLVEEQVLRAQGNPCRVCVHGRFDCTTSVFLHFSTFRDIFGCVRVSWVLTLLLMFAEQQQGWEELGWM